MNEKYIIIAGTNKAATTSFYEYLAAHPSVCPAFIKQTFFFLDKEWQQNLNLQSLYNYEKGLDQYKKFFRNCNNKLYKLEASPEYIYAPGTPERIYQFLQDNNGQVIFILRDPVSRFLSLFHFGKQQGIINRKCSFHEFLEKSIAHTANTNSSLMAYETGFYSNYLENYVKLFGKDRLLIYFFEDIKTDAKIFMKKVADDLQIDSAFYDDFEFQSHNKTITVKNRFLSDAYRQARGFLIHHTFRSKIGYTTSMLLKKTVTPLYRKINLTERQKEKIPDADKQFLQHVYKDEKQRLESLFGIQVPW